jgi:hypothetical protein
VTYAQLVEMLAAMGGGGVTNNESNIKNKINRGKLTAAFMLECLSAIGVASLSLE